MWIGKRYIGMRWVPGGGDENTMKNAHAHRKGLEPYTERLIGEGNNLMGSRYKVAVVAGEGEVAAVVGMR